MVAYWIRIRGVTGSSRGQVEILIFFHGLVMFLFEIMQKNCFLKLLHFPQIYYHTSLYGPTTSGASVAPHLTSLCFRQVGITGCRTFKITICVTSVPNLIKNRPAVLELNYADRQTDISIPKRVNFMHIVRRTRNKQQNSGTGD